MCYELSCDVFSTTAAIEPTAMSKSGVKRLEKYPIMTSKDQSRSSADIVGMLLLARGIRHHGQGLPLSSCLVSGVI